MRDTGRQAKSAPTPLEVVRLTIDEEGYRAMREAQIKALRQSGWVELLSGLRADLFNMRRRGEFRSRVAKEAIDERIAEIGAALEFLKFMP